MERESNFLEEIVKLAFDSYNASITYTVAYSKGFPPKTSGFLVIGQSIVVKNEMEFDVTATHKS